MAITIYGRYVPTDIISIITITVIYKHLLSCWWNKMHGFTAGWLLCPCCFIRYGLGLMPMTSTITPQASLSGTFLQNSARIGYVTEGALFISVELPADAVSELRKV